MRISYTNAKTSSRLRVCSASISVCHTSQIWRVFSKWLLHLLNFTKIHSLRVWKTISIYQWLCAFCHIEWKCNVLYVSIYGLMTTNDKRSWFFVESQLLLLTQLYESDSQTCFFEVFAFSLLQYKWNIKKTSWINY